MRLGAFISLMLIVFVVLVVALLAYTSYQEKKRRQALEQLASHLGMQFTANGIQLPSLAEAGFELLQRGSARRFYNCLSKRLINGTEISVFDYQYTTGSGDRRNTHRLSVFAAYREDLHLPSFRLHPENTFFHGIAKAFGMKDINFESHPYFSRSYLLRGEDEEQVRLRFHPGVLRFLEEHPNCAAEGCGSHLIFWRSGKQLEPQAIANFIRLGEELVQRLSPI